ncbi:hypothetical protein [Microbacterium karelineae]|uniref:hypothetical protein n=1 Tax=Microbacterium karelineae TaxID=2654283 RepID=UPI0018D28637|nr:hypothetical protein [Microbacterium karelineae]
MTGRFATTFPSGTTHVMASADRTECGKQIPAFVPKTTSPGRFMCSRCETTSEESK